MALVFCSECNEAVADGWMVEGKGYHKKHPAPAGPIDNPVAGRCQWGSGHPSPAIWQTPRDGRFYCREHLARIIRVATWRP